MDPRCTRGDDGIHVWLYEPEVDLLRSIPAQLRAVYDDEGGGEIRERLFPRAYLDPTAEAEEREFEALVHPDLLAQRLAVLDEFTTSLDRFEGDERLEAVLVDEEPEVWLKLLNDARLALGTRLAITEEERPELPEDHPEFQAYLMYDWLTYLQGELVETLLD